jgi:hypothetical protein
VDGVCSEESCEFIEEHIRVCQSCKKLLENMNVDLNISTKEGYEEDVNVIKKVKKRIWIEKIVITAVALLVAGIFMLGMMFKLTVSEINMNDIIDFNEVYVEEDQEGNLWLVRSGNGSAAKRIFPEVCDDDGSLMISSERIIHQLEERETYQARVVFYESPLNYTIQKVLGSDLSDIKKEKSMLFSKEALKKYNEIVIVKSDGTKKILWEKER